MTDKVQKIREEVVEIINDINPFSPDEDGKNSSYEAGKFDVAQKILQIIDSLQEEPVSEEFEQALAKEWQGYVDRGAATVDALEDNIQELAFAKGFYRGSKWKEQQMMKDATEAIVAIDAGGYPYIPQIELYDYDKDVPLAKEGDKYKVVLIKKE